MSVTVEDTAEGSGPGSDSREAVCGSGLAPGGCIALIENDIVHKLEVFACVCVAGIYVEGKSRKLLGTCYLIGVACRSRACEGGIGASVPDGRCIGRDSHGEHTEDHHKYECDR